MRSSEDVFKKCCGNCAHCERMNPHVKYNGLRCDLGKTPIEYFTAACDRFEIITKED